MVRRRVETRIVEHVEIPPGTAYISTFISYIIELPDTHITTYITELVTKATAINSIYLLDGKPYTTIVVPTDVVVSNRYITRIVTEIVEESEEGRTSNRESGRYGYRSATTIPGLSSATKSSVRRKKRIPIPI